MVAFRVASANFYGENYSEYDWDADNPRHYLYDHGVELETIQMMNTTNGWSWSGGFLENSQKLPYGLYIAPPASNKFSGFGTSSTINFANYNLFRVVADPTGGGSATLQFGVRSSKNLSAAEIANVTMAGEHETYLDVSSISDNDYMIMYGVNVTSRYGYVYEMWLE